MKKFLALLCLAAMLCLMLVSCDDEKESSSDYDDYSSYSYDDDYQEAVDNWREASEKMDGLIADYKRSQN